MATAPNQRVLSPGEVLEPESAPAVAQEWFLNLNVKLICPDCKEVPPNLVEEFSSGDTVCGSCGLVLSGRIVDTRSEWRTFSNDDQGNDDPSRVGDAANPLLNGSQLQTNIAFGNGDNRNRDLHRAQNKATHDKATKTLLEAYRKIGSFCDSLHLPTTVADTAKHFFKTAEESKTFKGKTQDAVIASCIFIACRQNNVPRTFKEIQHLTQVPKKDIGRAFKLLDNFLTKQSKKQALVTQGGLVLANDAYGATSSTNAGELCRRFCNALGLSNKTSINSEKIAERITASGWLAGRSPLSVAAACIYFVSHLMGEPKSPKEIAVIAGVSDGTIRTAYKFLYDERANLINEDWVRAGNGGDVSKLPQA